MNILHDISEERIKPDDFITVIEIEKDSQNKYEIDKETGLLYMDRVLYTSTHYPANYGFIPLTHCDDNDPLDVFVYSSQSIQPMSLVRCYPLGAIDMLDSNKIDTKVIAVPFGDPQFNSYKEIEDLPPHLIDELMHFLRVYKDLENKTTVISGFHDSAYAKQQITKALQDYKVKFNKK